MNPVHPLPLDDLLSETPEETLRRLRHLADVELDEQMDSGAFDATAVDGSLGTGSLWPSSDLDMTLVLNPAHVVEGRPLIQWDVREGLVVHRHRNRRAELDDLCARYPESFIELASGKWVVDGTWLLDGLATLGVRHDLEGYLARVRDFVSERRFAPEIVQPRRALLLALAQTQWEESRSFYAGQDETTAPRTLERVLELVGMVVLEAAGRIISLKELDRTLREVGEALALPDLHRLYREAAGVASLNAAPLAAHSERLLRLLSPWTDVILAHRPGGGEKEWRRHWGWAYHAYQRQRIWAGIYAAERDCLLYLAALRRQIAGADFAESLPEYTRQWGEGAGAAAQMEAESVLPVSALREARQAFLDAFPLPPFPERLAAAEKLLGIVTERCKA